MDGAGGPAGEEQRRLERKTALPIGWATGGANVAGALLTYLYLQFLAPGAFDRGSGSIWNFVVSAVILPLYLIGTVALMVQRMRPETAGWGACLEPAAQPSARQRQALLRYPMRLARYSFGAWVGAAALYGTLNVAFGNPVLEDVRIAVGILFAGVVTSAITFLLAERGMRPVVALALRGVPADRRGLGVHGRLVTAWVVGSALPLVALSLLPLARTPGGLVSLPVSIASLAAIGLVAGYLLIRGTADAISQPLTTVRRGLDAVRRGDLSVEVPVDDAGEFGRLEADVNSMVAGLRERQRLQELFGRHVGEEVARQALSEETVLGGRRRQVSVLFVDLIGSTELAASRPPDEVVTVLNRLFGCVVDAVTTAGGWVNKFEGDAALCVFGAPGEQADHAGAALRAARDLRRQIHSLSPAGDELDAAIGVSSGTVVAGNVGAVDRYEYTVIGDPVNEAARLCELAKTRPERVLASGATVAAAGIEADRWRGEGEVVLRGRQRPTVLAVPVQTTGELGQPPATAGMIETV